MPLTEHPTPAGPRAPVRTTPTPSNGTALPKITFSLILTHDAGDQLSRPQVILSHGDALDACAAARAWAVDTCASDTYLQALAEALADALIWAMGEPERYSSADFAVDVSSTPGLCEDQFVLQSARH